MTPHLKSAQLMARGQSIGPCLSIRCSWKNFNFELLTTHLFKKIETDQGASTNITTFPFLGILQGGCQQRKRACTVGVFPCLGGGELLQGGGQPVFSPRPGIPVMY